ncbi:amidase [Pseudidiomarina terrestris]|uniref:Amidase n=1 Tax=Pseudidiomarina terrestris TaxID=2820060 RepID=A0AAW7R4J3_9GAMM|nr:MULTISPECIES: amidase [unclassified Pseudidiomarina]MDN7125449.1 amidase [Pseudidiomarina sp. 1APP75-32.1]MDN7128057.1 amidase [Pseudidiomarina sp. 1APR75-33.1]MDN7130207.1 amidase [Pseudidiomarina sp. 1APR75-15]MDN7135716.1 amidase [Pseudidiomarina sp. 1ASP75-5]MDN7137247.1 amidase [Pseudidiomarina sp. 1ASP75-14]
MKYMSATTIASQTASGELSSTAITDYYLGRIDNYNPQLNAFVDIFAEQARYTAKLRDQQQREDKPVGVLHGVPVSVKECYQIKDTKTTLNYQGLRNYVSDSTSLLVQRLVDAGAVVLGKTNVPSLLADAQTFGPIYPTCNNPYALDRTPGGSTGGGAAALAADLCALEIGSDIGGSIRNPAHNCGLFGFKPTENGHHLDGHIPPLPHLDLGLSVMNCTGPLARSAVDLELAYNVLFAPDWEQRLYLPIAREQKTPDDLSGYSFGFVDNMAGVQPGSEVRNAMQRTRDKLIAAGAEVNDIRIDQELAREALVLWVELFGYAMGQTLRLPVRKLLYWQYRHLFKRSSLPADQALKALSSGLSLNFKAFSRALKRRQEIVTEALRQQKSVDIIVSPTTLGPAFPHNKDHKAVMLDGEKIPYVDFCFPFVNFFSLTGQPVVTVPTGLTESGLPVGLCFAAAHHQDQTLLHLAQLMEKQGFTFQPPDFGKD